jgi:hypothetical protein
VLSKAECRKGLTDFKARKVRHHQIEQDSVGLVLERQCDRLFGIATVDDVIGVFKAGTEKTSHSFIVVDNQDSLHAFIESVPTLFPGSAKKSK